MPIWLFCSLLFSMTTLLQVGVYMFICLLIPLYVKRFSIKISFRCPFCPQSILIRKKGLVQY